MADGSTAGRQHRRRRAARPSSIACGSGSIAVVAYALVDASPGRGGYLRGIGERYATAAGPAGALLGRIVSADAGGTTLEVHGLDPLAGATTIRLATAGRHNAANALGRRRRRPQPRRGAGRASRPASRRSAASAGVWSARARRPASWSTTTTATTRPRSRATLAAVRQREPGRRVWAVYEPLTYHRTAAMLGAFAEALADGRRGRRRRHLGRPRPGHDDASRPRTWPRRSDRSGRASRSSPRARSRRPRTGWPARSGRRRGAGDGRRRGATGSANGCWSDWRRTR